MEPLEKLFKKIESYNNNNKIKEATRIKNRRKRKKLRKK
jgi:hypothetical protein